MFITGMKESPTITSCSLASVMSSQQPGKYTNEYPDAGKEMQFTETEIGEKKFIKCSWVENLHLLQVLECPAILHVEYIFYLTETVLTTFDCHVLWKNFSLQNSYFS